VLAAAEVALTHAHDRRTFSLSISSPASEAEDSTNLPRSRSASLEDAVFVLLVSTGLTTNRQQRATAADWHKQRRMWRGLLG
jgi:hypothetical protein